MPCQAEPHSPLRIVRLHLYFTPTAACCPPPAAVPYTRAAICTLSRCGASHNGTQFNWNFQVSGKFWLFFVGRLNQNWIFFHSNHNLRWHLHGTRIKSKNKTPKKKSKNSMKWNFKSEINKRLNCQRVKQKSKTAFY